MVATEERRASEGIERKETERRRKGLFIGAIALVVAIIVATVVLAMALGNEEEVPAAAEPVVGQSTTVPINEPAAGPPAIGSPQWVMAELVAAIQPLDPSGFAELAAPLNSADTSFLEWNLALGMEPIFTDCVATPGSTQTYVTCSVGMGQNYFFSRIEGTNVETSVSATISNSTGQLLVSGWPPPTGLVGAELDFQEWIRANHPEEEDRMFGNDFAGVVAFSREAGELHMQYADAYLADLATADTPEGVMNDIMAAVQQGAPEGFADLTAPLDAMGTRFLAWNLALGMDPTFTDCTITPGSFVADAECTVAMGEDYFFSRVEGANVTTSVAAIIENSSGELTVMSWPPPVGLVAAEKDFRQWIREHHPAEEERMFGNDYAGVIRFSKEAGELHTRYADEYLASLN